MKYLNFEDAESNNALKQAIDVAKKATCQRSKCGAVIIRNNEVLGSGFNSPPANLENQRRCSNSKDDYNKKITDKTCCIHAEQRAIFDALKNNSDKILGSRLYFIRLGEDEKPKFSGEPYCTICSKMALDQGIKEFVLWTDKGFCVYDTEEYNDISYNYGKNNKTCLC